MNKNKVILNDDQKEVLFKSLKDINFACSQLRDWVSKDNLSEDMSKKLPALIEDYFSKAASVLNYDSYLLEEKAKRYDEVREISNKFYELEAKLASSKPVDGLDEQLKHLSQKVTDWWSKEGFNHVSNQKYYPHGGLNLEFHFMLSLRKVISDTPITDKLNDEQHIENLRGIGFEFADFEYGDSEKLNLIDNQNNRTLLTNILRERFPSIKIHGWKNMNSYSNPDIFVIFHVDATIYDLSDI